ncbi:MAG TPA: cytochrome c oxidase accessory protein CcoG [Methylomirabilota bacterium]|nr:cytochrome c oxidase accessory protein CcoG [Methylomirabilota bacterium]
MPAHDPKPPPETLPAVQEIDWEDYRDHLATADKEGRRRWVYPKKPAGRWHRRRVWLGVGLIAIMFAGPWIRIHGNPLLLVNIVERRFSILGQIFWPQDTIIFAVAMLVFITGIIVFTTAFGRLWCGWTCPQTVMMELVFRKIEYLIEGDAPEQRALNAAPWGARKIFKKVLKHGTFFALSFIIGNTLLAYIIGSEQLLAIQFDDPRHHLVGLTFMLLFTLLFYGIFARFREQACTFICPYGRFQSTLLDENTMVVAYDYKRGERRGPLRRGQSWGERQAAGLGDCVACRQCVAVCPTGIDIRNGTQMECVNCTACIDACDAVMDKIGRPRGLIRLASLNSIERGEKLRFTRRMQLYSGVLAALVALFLYLVFTRSEVETTFLRAPGTLFQLTADGFINNLYTVKVVNKSSRDLPVEFRVKDLPARLRVIGAGTLTAPGGQLAQGAVLIELPPNALAGASTPLQIGVYSNGRLIETVKTVFAGPRPATP